LDVGPVRNISPHELTNLFSESADGEIPVVMQDRLLGLGRWLQVNGEAIYFTRKYNYQMEGQGTIFYTQNKNTKSGGNFHIPSLLIILILVYAIFTAWPDNNVLTLEYAIPGNNTNITMLGYSEKLHYTYHADKGLSITLPRLNPSKESFLKFPLD
jgi:alpha-L-fucosidase